MVSIWAADVIVTILEFSGDVFWNLTHMHTYDIFQMFFYTRFGMRNNTLTVIVSCIIAWA